MFGMDPLLRGQLGKALLVLGLGFAVLASILWGGYYLRVSNATAGGGATASVCEGNLRSLGAAVVQEAGRVTATWAGVDGGMETFGKASGATTICPGWVMDTFCMGQACEVPGARVVLRQANV